MKKPIRIIKAMQAITKAIKVLRNQKRFLDFAIRSDFSFSIIDKISVTSIFFCDWFKVAKLLELCEKVNGLFFTRRISSGNCFFI